MQADREDRFAADINTSRHSTQTLITAIAVLILAGGAYLLVPADDEETRETPPAPSAKVDEQPIASVVVPPRPAPEPQVLAAPDIPQPADPNAMLPFTPVQEDTAPDADATAPPPTPEEIDAQLRDIVASEGLTPRGALATAYQAPYLLDRGVSSLDQMSRGLVPRRTLNLPRPRGDFAVTRSGLDYAIDSAAYARYDEVTAAITAIDPSTLASLFRRLRPQLADAYALLGYPVDAMDNTVISALDAIIGAPVSDAPPALVSKGALWAYADSRLEGATDLEKQLLRAGPTNTRALQRWAAALRQELLNP